MQQAHGQGLEQELELVQELELELVQEHVQELDYDRELPATVPSTRWQRLESVVVEVPAEHASYHSQEALSDSTVEPQACTFWGNQAHRHMKVEEDL